jgi:hypothetical protein
MPGLPDDDDPFAERRRSWRAARFFVIVSSMFNAGHVGVGTVVPTPALGLVNDHIRHRSWLVAQDDWHRAGMYSPVKTLCLLINPGGKRCSSAFAYRVVMALPVLSSRLKDKESPGVGLLSGPRLLWSAWWCWACWPPPSFDIEPKMACLRAIFTDVAAG